MPQRHSCLSYWRTRLQGLHHSTPLHRTQHKSLLASYKILNLEHIELKNIPVIKITYSNAATSSGRRINGGGWCSGRRLKATKNAETSASMDANRSDVTCETATRAYKTEGTVHTIKYGRNSNFIMNSKQYDIILHVGTYLYGAIVFFYNVECRNLMPTTSCNSFYFLIMVQ